MFETTSRAHNGAMNHEQLFDLAVQLAYRAFAGDTTDGHITGMYARLVFNAERGLEQEGACTLH
jgi:hypothetical protein